MTHAELQQQIVERWPDQAQCRAGPTSDVLEVKCAPSALTDLCGRLFRDWDFSFAALIVEEGDAEWEVRYIFYGARPASWVHVIVTAPLAEPRLPSLASAVHAVDWQEREVEDLFGLIFEGHPRLGDFVLHDDAWQEDVQPMRRRFNPYTPMDERRPNLEWRPRRLVEAPGAFVMPVGPVFSGLAEPAHFQLETVGEDVIRAFPRLFYKYRGIEKIAEAKPVADVLLLAERFAAATAVAHALAFCQAVETVSGAAVPARAQALRVFVAELERFRHHMAAIAAICEATGLAVAASQAALLEEDLLRVSGTLAGHRYLFGLVVPGGLATDLTDAACGAALRSCQEILERSNRLWEMLRLSSSFMDRVEGVGVIAEGDARDHGLVGPIARASGISRDLRAAQPYGGYAQFAFFPAREREGDGYARLRVLFAEARQSVRLMEQAAAALSPGPVCTPIELRSGAAVGAVEAPRGAAFHWVRLKPDGTVSRYRIVPPSFINWHGFHLAVEDFAFQDFPIILATLDLSVAENDR
jgi:formate hydrogenlyase subunit 5